MDASSWRANPLGLDAEAWQTFSAAKQVVLVARHGDREDYASPAWAERMRLMGYADRDPPLSRLGHEQSRSLGEALRLAAERRPDDSRRIASSPYLRCLQTADHCARAIGAKVLEIDAGLAEVWHRPSYVPSLAERFRYFPRISLGANYQSPDDDDDDQAGDEHFPSGYLSRVGAFARRLVTRLDADTRPSLTLLVSHAASVALVASLADQPLDSSLAFAPVGLYVLVRQQPRQPFLVLRSGHDNGPYVTVTSHSTPPCALFTPDVLAQIADDDDGGEFPPKLFPDDRP